MQVAPTEAMGRGAHEHHARLRWRRDLAWAAIAGWRCAGALRKLAPIDGKPIGGYAATLLAIAAAALAAPAVVLAVNRADARRRAELWRSRRACWPAAAWPHRSRARR